MYTAFAKKHTYLYILATIYNLSMYGGTSKFRGNPNFGAMFSSLSFSLYGRFCITFSSKVDAHLIARENGIETIFIIYYLLFGRALGVFLSGHTFLQQNGAETLWIFSSKTKMRTKTINSKKHFTTANASIVSHVISWIEWNHTCFYWWQFSRPSYFDVMVKLYTTILSRWPFMYYLKRCLKFCPITKYLDIDIKLLY